MLSVILGNHDEVHRIGLWWPALMGTLVVMMPTAIPAARLRPVPAIECDDMVTAT